MHSIAIAGVALAAGLALATPASASVKYDPGTKTGFVGRSDVQKAFGWSDPVFAARASGVVFDHDFWTDDIYSVTCGGPAFPVVHHREYGRFELTDSVVGGGRGGAPAGYLAGFRLTGPHLGISGTSVPPMIGQPCPADRAPAIDTVRLMSSTTGWTLTATSQDVSQTLLSRSAVTAVAAAQHRPPSQHRHSPITYKAYLSGRRSEDDARNRGSRVTHAR